MSRRASFGSRFRAAIALLLGMTLLTGCDFDVYKLPLPGGTDTGDNPITVTVRFDDVLDLVPMSSVKVNDVSVGQVTDIELDGYQAVVKLELRVAAGQLVSENFYWEGRDEAALRPARQLPDGRAGGEPQRGDGWRPAPLRGRPSARVRVVHRHRPRGPTPHCEVSHNRHPARLQHRDQRRARRCRPSPRHRGR